MMHDLQKAIEQLDRDLSAIEEPGLRSMAEVVLAMARELLQLRRDVDDLARSVKQLRR